MKRLLFYQYGRSFFSRLLPSSSNHLVEYLIHFPNVKAYALIKKIRTCIFPEYLKRKKSRKILLRHRGFVRNDSSMIKDLVHLLKIAFSLRRVAYN